MRRPAGLRLAGRFRDRGRSWREVGWAVVDLEMTGLRAGADTIVSFGVVPVDGGLVRLDRHTSRVVDPMRPLPADAVAIHGIRPSDLDGAPPFAEVAHELRDALEGRIVAAWSSWVEATFLSAALGGSANSWSRRIVDVRRLAMLADHLAGVHPSPAAKESLAAAAERFGVPPDREHHALWDAFVTAQLLVVVATILERRGRGRTGMLRAAGIGSVRLDPRRPPAPPLATPA